MSAERLRTRDALPDDARVDPVGAAMPVSVDAATLASDPAARPLEPASPSSSPPSSSAPAPKRARGTDAPRVIGRYVVVRRLGAGGMGEVFAAYDNELERAVAIKLLLDGRERGEAQTRMLREAQGLARLSHPNVVQVYEVGRHEGQVYIAMELLRGQTLADWLAARPAPRLGAVQRRLLDMFIQAGRGLAAAHAVGLVHRDFKPENVFVGEDGRVRVLDFGLVTTRRATAPPPAERAPASASLSGSSDVLSVELTTKGSILGTPAYMAPEQYRGGVAGARADQFSFCVSLYEALYGERPFAGRSLHAIAQATLSGRVREPTRGARVPAWLRRALLRGLAAAPEARWPSMDALLGELSRDRGRTRRRLLLGALVVAALAAGAYGLTHAAGAEERACASADELLAGVWDEPRRARLRDAVLQSGLAYAEDTWTRVEQGLDRHAADWRARYADACVARARAAPGEVLPDLKIACLEERRVELRALVDSLGAGERATIERAVEAVSKNITPLATCARAEALAIRVASPGRAPPALAAELRAALARGSALAATGKYDEARALADDTLAAARQAGDDALLAESLLLLAELLQQLGEDEPAASRAAEAIEMAHRSGHDSLTGNALRVWIYLTGVRLDRPEVARAWFGLARASVTRAGGADDGAEIALLNTMAAVERESGAYARARDLHQQALTMQERVDGPDDPGLSHTLNGLGAALAHLGEYAEAQALLERASAIDERTYGPLHPALATTLHNQGALYLNVGQHDRARPFLERALAIRERSLGRDSPRLVGTLSTLGLVRSYTGEYAEARALLERAVAIADQHGAEHREVLADALTNLGVVHSQQGDDAGALVRYQRALELLAAIHGPDHPGLYNALNNLGVTHENLGHLDEARAHYERAYRVRVAAVGEQHPSLGFALLGLGELELAAGHDARAVEQLERAVALWSRYPPRPSSLAKARFALAQALWRTGQRERALELAGQAARGLEDAPGDAELATTIHAWLTPRRRDAATSTRRASTGARDR